MLIPLDQEIESSPLYVIDAITGRRLEFKVKLLRGGFFGYLIGTAVDGGDWPRDWTLSEQFESKEMEENVYLSLPPAEIDSAQLDQLITWLAEQVGTVEDVVLFPPATNRDVDHLVAQEEVKVPPEYKKFVSITNGMDVGKTQILGTKDAYRLDVPGYGPSLVVASLGEDGVIAVPSGESNLNEVLLCTPGDKTEKMKVSLLASTLRKFIAALIWGTAGKVIANREK